MSIFSQEELPRSPKDDGFFEGADLLQTGSFEGADLLPSPMGRSLANSAAYFLAPHTGMWVIYLHLALQEKQ